MRRRNIAKAGLRSSGPATRDGGSAQRAVLADGVADRVGRLASCLSVVHLQPAPFVNCNPSMGDRSPLVLVLFCAAREGAKVGTRKIAAILVSDVVGYSRLAGADEDRTLSRLRGLRSDLVDPAVDAHRGRIVKRTGDGSLIEFRSVVDAVRCAIEVQQGLIERHAGVPAERRIEFRVGIHLGDVVEEADGDLMGDGVNIAARLEGIAKPGAICLSEDAYRQVSGRLDMEVTDLGPTKLKNIEKPIRAYSLEVGKPALAKPARTVAPSRRSMAVLLMVGVAALIAIAAGAWHFWGANRALPAEAAQVSLVVLPFSNLSGDASQDYFGDVLTEELTTSLSRLPDSFVVSRTTAFSYRGKAMDVKQIGKELGVRYALEGSAQKSGTRVRVDAQLIDAASGAHLWADQFDADETDLLTMQDEIVTRLARALQVELTAAVASRVARAHPENPDARNWPCSVRPPFFVSAPCGRKCCQLTAFANRRCELITAMFARW